MPKSKPKKFKPTLMWAVIDEKGLLVMEHGFPLMFTGPKSWARSNMIEGERMVRVEIREVRP